MLKKVKQYYKQVGLTLFSLFAPLFVVLTLHSEHLLHFLVALPFVLVSLFIYLKPSKVSSFSTRFFASIFLIALFLSQFSPLSLDHLHHLTQDNAGVHICCVMPVGASSPEVIAIEIDQINYISERNLEIFNEITLVSLDHNKSPPTLTA
jgi:exosortase/archaeosortase